MPELQIDTTGSWTGRALSEMPIRQPWLRHTGGCGHFGTQAGADSGRAYSVFSAARNPPLPRTRRNGCCLQSEAEITQPSRRPETLGPGTGRRSLIRRTLQPGSAGSRETQSSEHRHYSRFRAGRRLLFPTHGVRQRGEFATGDADQKVQPGAGAVHRSSSV